MKFTNFKITRNTDGSCKWTGIYKGKLWGNYFDGYKTDAELKQEAIFVSEDWK